MLTVQQLVERLQVSDETIYRYIRIGILKASRVGGLWRVSEEALEDFLDNRSGRRARQHQSGSAV